MNENPEGTPNPLNPAPSFGRAENTPESGEATGIGTPEVTEVTETLEAASFTEPAKPAEPANEANNEPEVAKPAPRVNHSMVDPMMRPVSRPEPAPKPNNNFDTLQMDEATIEELTEDTMAAPNPVSITRSDSPELVAKDSIVEPVGKSGGKKKAFIIAAIIFIIAAIICGAAAIAIFVINNAGGDRVTKAIDKLLNGEMPDIVAVQGDITVSPNNSLDGGFTSIKFDGAFDTVNGTNTVSADVGMALSGGNDLNLSINELRDKKGNIFFKVGGFEKVLTAMTDQPLTLDCSGDTDCVTTTEPTTEDVSGTFSVFGGLLEAINDEWILISDDFANQMNESPLFENTSTCLINSLKTLPSYSKDFVNKYKQNQFITYSTDNLEIAKKHNYLYKIGFDKEKLKAFADSLGNSGFANELNACAENTAGETVMLGVLDEIVSSLPTIYVEVDDNNNFTRVYFKGDATINGEDGVLTADLDLSYPAKIEISEPEDYVDISNLLTSVLTNLFTE